MTQTARIQHFALKRTLVEPAAERNINARQTGKAGPSPLLAPILKFPLIWLFSMSVAISAGGQHTPENTAEPTKSAEETLLIIPPPSPPAHPDTASSDSKDIQPKKTAKKTAKKKLSKAVQPLRASEPLSSLSSRPTAKPGQALIELREGKTPQLHMSPSDGLALVQKMISERRFDMASQVLGGLEQVPGTKIDQTEVAFLRGMIALEQQEFDQAEEIFRTILDKKPELVRVRLELARTLFGQKRDRAAAYHFRLALAGDLPDSAKQNIQAFLWIIQQRRNWQIKASAGFVPDTNVSAGPRNTIIELNGLPFELDDNGRARSGIGFTSSFIGEVFPKIAKRWRLEARGGASFTDYSNRTFDDLNLTAEAGIRHEREAFSVSILANAARRVFGGNGFNRSIGGRLVVEKGLNRRTALQVSLSGANVRYDRDILRNGAIYFFGTTLQRSLTSRSLVRGSLTVTREHTREPVLQNTIIQLRPTYRRELPLGITAEIGPELYYRSFDERDTIDPVRRQDWSYGASIYITKRDWRLYGFAPVISYQYLHNNSTVDRFDFGRHRANIGVTRTF